MTKDKPTSTGIRKEYLAKLKLLSDRSKRSLIGELEYLIDKELQAERAEASAHPQPEPTE